MQNSCSCFVSAISKICKNCRFYDIICKTKRIIFWYDNVRNKEGGEQS